MWACLYLVKMLVIPILVALLAYSHLQILLVAAVDPVPSSTVSTSVEVISSSPHLSPLTSPTDGEESWLDEHLSLVIGVPTGLGLCIIMFLGCLLYCGVSAAYHSWRENRPHGDSYYQGGGTGTTGYTGTTGTTPHTSSAGYNSSMYNASSFEPSADTLPRGTKMSRHPMSETSVNEDSIAIDPSEATSTF